jgi:hypothetical protein
MKRLAIVAVLGMLLSSVTGCQCCERLWGRGPAYQQPCQPAVAYPAPSGPPCTSCEAGAGVPVAVPSAPMIAPGAPAIVPGAPAIAPAVVAPGPEATVPPAR